MSDMMEIESDDLPKSEIDVNRKLTIPCSSQTTENNKESGEASGMNSTQESMERNFCKVTEEEIKTHHHDQESTNLKSPHQEVREKLSQVYKEATEETCPEESRDEKERKEEKDSQELTEEKLPHDLKSVEVKSLDEKLGEGPNSASSVSSSEQSMSYLSDSKISPSVRVEKELSVTETPSLQGPKESDPIALDSSYEYYTLESILSNPQLIIPFDEEDDEYDLEFPETDFYRIDMLRNSAQPKSVPEPYPRASLTHNTFCTVCCEETSVRKRLCCSVPVCDSCMQKFIEENVSNGTVAIKCIGLCDSFVHRDEILNILPIELKEKYYRFLVDANHDPMVKTCPQCSTVYNMTKDELKSTRKKAKGQRSNVTCPKCDLVWCFPCHAPAHQGITCKEFSKGDKMLKSWAKLKLRGCDVNAQKCPKCKVFIERNGGCSHMTCKHCGTNFCYKCGERYITSRCVSTVFGNHHSMLSTFGCKYKLMPNYPVARKLIRGSVLGAKVLGGLVLGGLIVAAGVIFVGTSFIVVPAYAGYRYRQESKMRKFWKKQQIRQIEIPKLAVRTGDLYTLNEESSIFGSVDGDTDNISAYDESPESGTDHDPSQEVEVWVHCHQSTVQPNQEQETATMENIDRDNLTQTTAKLSKDPDQSDVLYVKTAYTSVDQEKLTCKKNGSEMKENCSSKNSEEPDSSGKVKSDLNNRTNDPNEDSSDSDSPENQTNKKLSDKDEEISEENSTTQGCFVRIFGKKIPVVWEKGHEDDLIKSQDGKQKEGSGSLGRSQGHSSKTLDRNIEKKKSLSSSVKLQTGSLDRNLKKHSSGDVTVIRQPDIVTSVLQSKQANQMAEILPCDHSNMPVSEGGEVIPEVDPYYGVVSLEDCNTPL